MAQHDILEIMLKNQSEKIWWTSDELSKIFADINLASINCNLKKLWRHKILYREKYMYDNPSNPMSGPKIVYRYCLWKLKPNTQNSLKYSTNSTAKHS